MPPSVQTFDNCEVILTLIRGAQPCMVVSGGLTWDNIMGATCS